jgi:hypothetical protein
MTNKEAQVVALAIEADKLGKKILEEAGGAAFSSIFCSLLGMSVSRGAKSREDMDAALQDLCNMMLLAAYKDFNHPKAFNDR